MRASAIGDKWGKPVPKGDARQQEVAAGADAEIREIIEAPKK